MAKTKGYVDVIGITRGKEPEVIATFSERKDANWHVNNTFVEEDKCVVKKTNVKGNKLVKDKVASDRDTYIKALATMDITDLEKLTIETEGNTLLGMILSGELGKESDLGKLQEVEGGEGVKQVQVIYNENDAFPHSKVKKKLEDDLIKDLVGEEEDETIKDVTDETETLEEEDETEDESEAEEDEEETDEEGADEEESEDESEEETDEDDSDEEDEEETEEDEEESEEDESEEEDLDDEDLEGLEDEEEDEDGEEESDEDESDDGDEEIDLSDEDLEELEDLD